MQKKFMFLGEFVTNEGNVFTGFQSKEMLRIFLVMLSIPTTTTTKMPEMNEIANWNSRFLLVRNFRDAIPSTRLLFDRQIFQLGSNIRAETELNDENHCGT